MFCFWSQVAFDGYAAYVEIASGLATIVALHAAENSPACSQSSVLISFSPHNRSTIDDMRLAFFFFALHFSFPNLCDELFCICNWLKSDSCLLGVARNKGCRNCRHGGEHDDRFGCRRRRDALSTMRRLRTTHRSILRRR